MTRARASAWTVAAVVLLVAMMIRLRLLEVPLDRDEGEYAYIGRLLLEGVPPYAGAYNLKMPGIYGAYALILGLFGQTAAAVHAGLIVVNAATAALVYALASRLYGAGIALLTAATFAVVSLSPTLLGHAAYAEHFVLLPVTAGCLALLTATRPETTDGRRWMWLGASGVLFGLGFLFKQSGAGFTVAGLGYVLCCGTVGSPSPARARARAAAVFAGAAVMPVALLCAWLLVAGTFPVFWFWTFVYASHYGAPLLTGVVNLGRAVDTIVPSCWVILGFVGLGLATLIGEGATPRRNLLLLLAAGAALGTGAGLHFREHYFLLMAPAVALLTALGVNALAGFASRGAPRTRVVVSILFAAVALAQPLYSSHAVLFALAPAQVPREIYGRHPFPESVEIGRFIRERSTPSDRVAIVGSEPQIYFYADRRSATGYIYTFPLMERHPYASAMQRQMIAEIEASNPRYLVFVSANLSWLIRRDSDRTIFNWFGHYQKNFRRVGVADVVSMQETVYRWGDDAASYKPRSDIWLMVLERER
jgi:hypothetical protein